MTDKDITGPAWGEHLAAVERDLTEHKELLLEQLAHVEGGLAALTAVKARASEAVPQISDTQAAALKTLMTKAAEKAVKTARAGEAKTFSVRWDNVKNIVISKLDQPWDDVMKTIVITLCEQDYALRRKDILSLVTGDKELRNQWPTYTRETVQFSNAIQNLRKMDVVRLDPTGPKKGVNARWELA